MRALCAAYPDEYFRQVDAARGYPAEFVDALTRAGWMAALIPQQYGGSGLGLAEASVIMEEINACGGNAGACHGQMYNMGTLLRHGSAAQKALYLPRIASGELRLQSMAVTEPSAGTDTDSSDELTSKGFGLTLGNLTPEISRRLRLENGERGAIVMGGVRLTDPIAVDGRLDEPAWAQAATLTGFSMYEPVDRQAATDSTIVLVWYSPTAIHFGIKAHAPPGAVNANLSDRDKTTADDAVDLGAHRCRGLRRPGRVHRPVGGRDRPGAG